MYTEESGSKRRIFISRIIALALIGTLPFFATGCKKEIAKAPSTFSPYTAPDKSFACQAPDGWVKSESGSGGIQSGATFSQGRSRIDITSDLQGSLMADISRSSSSPMSGAENMLPGGMRMSTKPQKSPVEKLHDMGKKKMEDKWQEYSETPSNPFQSSLGEGRISEWTGSGGTFGGSKRHGLRVTILSGERRVTAICVCPEDDWKTLLPAFSRILKSLGPGGA